MEEDSQNERKKKEAKKAWRGDGNCKNVQTLRKNESIKELKPGTL